MNTKVTFLNAIVFSVLASSVAFASEVPAGNWQFQLQNASANGVIYYGMNGNCITLVQDSTFAEGTTKNAFSSSVPGYGSCKATLNYSYSGGAADAVCEVTVSATAKEVNDTTIKYSATASYQGNCVGPTSLGSGGTFTFTVK